MVAHPTLLASAALALITGALYAYVGRVVHRRDVEGDARLAARLFAIFWYALGAVTAASALNTLMGWAGVREPALFLTVTHAVFLVLCVALWALLYYFAYLFTGHKRLLWPVTIFYVGFYVWILYLLAQSGAVTNVVIEEWRVRLEFERRLDPASPAVRAFVVLLIVPPILGALAYARLFFKVDERTQRYRIGLVAGTIVAWFASSLIASVLQLGEATWWQLASRIIGVCAAGLIYLAYRPPRWIRERYGIRAIDEPAA